MHIPSRTPIHRALASGKRPCMREPDACPLLTSRHLLRPNRPLVPFAFLSLSLSLLRVSHGHRKLHPARPLVKRKQVPPRATALSLSLRPPLSTLSSFLFSLARSFRLIFRWTFRRYTRSTLSHSCEKTNRGISRFYLLPSYR